MTHPPRHCEERSDEAIQHRAYNGSNTVWTNNELLQETATSRLKIPHHPTIVLQKLLNR
jgi:hypothetical protein